MSNDPNCKNRIVILGAGLSGLSLAYNLQEFNQVEKIDIIEKSDDIGGLCRSIKKDGYVYDIGPHILFSKDKEMLQLMLDKLPEHNDLKRSNQIIYKKRYVQYPFENDLSKLPDEELRYCVTAFRNNPYRDYQPTNMLQFFLKTFGEGITNTYLRPYNEKIWKYDPSFMDVQMVERIPQPTDEEIERSAAGETVDGYLHQLFFHYPAEGGIEAVPRGFYDSLNEKCHVHLKQPVRKVYKENGKFCTETDEGVWQSDLLISTIPIQELSAVYRGIPSDISERVDDLKYNSILIAFVKTKEDLCGNNFAFMCPQKEIIFHRISKMDFLGENYCGEGATYMVEITYRQGDYIDQMPESEMQDRIKKGVLDVGFAKQLADIDIINITKHQYAYVIYDLNHRGNMDAIRDYFRSEGVYLNGRFGNFEYWNMDKILREARNMSELIGAEQK